MGAQIVGDGGEDIDVEFDDSYSPSEYEVAGNDMRSRLPHATQTPSIVYTQQTHLSASPLYRTRANATPAPFANAGPPGIHFYQPLIAQATPAATPIHQYRNVEAMATVRAASRFY